MEKRRRSVRLKGYDYSRPGYYFVTICTKDRECLLGGISDSIMNLNDTGKIIDCIWRELSSCFSVIAIDQYIIMPNHFHGIIKIEDQNKHRDLYSRGLINQTPTSDQISNDWILMKNPEITLGKIIRFFKAKSALEIRKKKDISFYWQRNYYEHIIRDKNELTRIRKYIRDNPANWPLDEDNPVNRMIR